METKQLKPKQRKVLKVIVISTLTFLATLVAQKNPTIGNFLNTVINQVSFIVNDTTNQTSNEI
nr:MAG: hypothetical protein [Microvirus sp.]